MSRDREDSRYFRELRKQIIKLKKENAALKKKLKQSGDFYEEYQELMESVGFLEEEKPKQTDKCPKCYSKINIFDLRNEKYYKCEECGSKGKYNA